MKLKEFFTALLVDFIRDKFIWAKTNKTEIDIISEEHDKRIAENYVFDKVPDRYVPRNEYEKQAKLNQDGYKPTPDKIRRFTSRPEANNANVVNDMNFIPSRQPVRQGLNNKVRFRPSNRRSIE